MAGVAAFTPAAVVDGSFELTAMLFRVVECASGGVDGVVVGLAGGFEFVEQHVEFVDALIDAFLLVAFGAELPERVEELGMHDLVGLFVPGRDLTARGRPVPHGAGVVAARSRRTLVAGRSARSLARTCTRTSTASAMSWLSVTTNTRFSTCPRVIATYKPLHVVAVVARVAERVRGVELVARLGRGVSELHVFSDVAGGQGDGAVSVDAGHGERPVGTDGVDGPVVAVADALPRRCPQEPFVASCRDHITDRHLEAVAEFEACLAELTEFTAVIVDGGVDGSDVVIRGRRDRHVLARSRRRPSSGRGCRHARRTVPQRCGHGPSAWPASIAPFSFSRSATTFTVRRSRRAGAHTGADLDRPFRKSLNRPSASW